MTLHMMYEEMISLYILERVKIKCITLNQFLCDKILHNKNGTEKWSRFSGSPINVPMPDTITLKLRNRKIREERNKHSVRELALKYGVSKRTVYDICSYKSNKGQTASGKG